MERDELIRQWKFVNGIYKFCILNDPDKKDELLQERKAIGEKLYEAFIEEFLINLAYILYALVAICGLILL